MLRYAADGGGNWAAAIALNTLLSLFPIVLAVLFAASLVLRDPDTRNRALGEIARVLPGGSGGDAFKELSSTIDAVRQGTGLLGVVGLAGLLWSGSALFGCIESALAAILRFPSRDFLRQKLMAFAMIIAFALLVVVAIVASSALALLTPIAEHASAEPILGGASRYLIQVAVGLLTGVLLFGLIFVVVPRPRPPLRRVLPGTVLAAAGFELLTLGFPLYIDIAGRGNRYGATFGLLLLIVSYVYLLAQLLVLGAVLNAVIGDRREAMSTALPAAAPAPASALSGDRATEAGRSSGAPEG